MELQICASATIAAIAAATFCGLLFCVCAANNSRVSGLAVTIFWGWWYVETVFAQ